MFLIKKINRRQALLAGGTITLGAYGAYKAKSFLAPKNDVKFLSAADDKKGNHFVVGLNQNAKLAFRIPVPNRMHDACYIPHKSLAIFAERRPDSQFHVIDTKAGILIASINAPKNHHFYGHSTYLASTDHLYLTESEYTSGKGVVGIYQAQAPFKRLGQFDSGGIGPHQISQLHHSNTLVVANGGILTHPQSKRKKLNIPDMAPNLSYINPTSGQILDSIQPPHHQMSIRHIAVSPNDTVAIGIQDQSEPLSRKHPSTLVLTHQKSSSLPPPSVMRTQNESWMQMRQYIASVAYSANSQYILTTAPKGNTASLWDTQKMTHVKHFSIKDAGGAAWDSTHQTFVVSNGLGELWAIEPTNLKPMLIAKLPNTRWDNHLKIST